MRPPSIKAVRSKLRRLQSAVIWRTSKHMWTYPKDKLDSSWKLQDLYDKTQTADLLGWDVRIKATDQGLFVEYVKRIPPELL